MSTFYSDTNPLFTTHQFTFNTPQENPADPYSVYKQQLINNYMSQITPAQPTQQDYLFDLDRLVKSLDKETLERLNQDIRYNELKTELQNSVQEEIMNIVKMKINSNPVLSKNIKEEMEIINKIKNDVKQEERDNYYEMQDYMKNYSNLTFDDYKKFKQNKKEN